MGKSISKTEVSEDKVEAGAGFSLTAYFVELLANSLTGITISDD